MAATQYSNYDSGDFPLIPDSLNHAKNNVFVLDKYSNKLVFNEADRQVVVVEPTCVIYDFLALFGDNIFEENLPKSEWYMPEASAKRIYGTHDFWYIIMYCTAIQCTIDYTVDKIRYIDPAQVYRVEKFLGKGTNNYRTVAPSDIIYR